MSEEIFSTDFPLEDSICKNCAYRLSKVISPIDPESLGITEEDLEELDLDDDEELLIEQHTCLVTQIDMDYIVKDCNCFRNVAESEFFIHNPYV